MFYCPFVLPLRSKGEPTATINKMNENKLIYYFLKCKDKNTTMLDKYD